MTTGTLDHPRPAVAGSAARPAPAILLQGAALAALLALVYHRTAATLWSVWTTNDSYSHGPLVPLVSLALIAARRHELAALPLAPDRRGLLLVAAACLLQIVGMRADVFALEGYSLVVMLFGLSLTFLGTAATRRLAFPLGYLVFMLIFPPFVVGQLSYALKEITVSASARLGEGLGAVLQRQGMILYLAGGELRIENPCSGLRSLIALLATGAVFAYLQPGGACRRALLFLSAIPIALAGNLCRITTLILVAHYAGLERATGAFHDQSGYVIYAVALLGLFGMRALLTPRGRSAPEVGP
jgi:exosortase